MSILESKTVKNHAKENSDLVATTCQRGTAMLAGGSYKVTVLLFVVLNGFTFLDAHQYKHHTSGCNFSFPCTPDDGC
jgi:hypothetical protein